LRDTVEEAHRDAEKLIEYVTPEIAAEGQRVLAKYESEGQKRMLELQRSGRDGLWLRPDLWAGIGLVRGGAGTAMVGDGATIAALMEQYTSLEIDTARRGGRHRGGSYSRQRQRRTEVLGSWFAALGNEA
jgi:alkanesulfonate monooxygenase